MLPFKMIQETEIEKWRAETFWDKEPETIVWIESFNDGDTFFDVGANIGIYSLYAAHLYLNSAIYAFEPHPGNLEHLVRNADLNEFTNIVTYPWPVGSTTEIGTFYVNDLREGSSGGQLHRPMNEYGRWFEPAKIEKLRIISLADFYHSRHISPNHIKIDVDGQEKAVVEGMIGIMGEGVLKSALVEINNDKEWITDMFASFGFSTDNIFNKLKNHSRVRRQKEGIKAENMVFTKR